MFFPAVQQPQQQSPKVFLAAQINAMTFLLMNEISELTVGLSQLENNPGTHTAPELVKYRADTHKQAKLQAEKCLAVLSKLRDVDYRAETLTKEDWQQLRDAQDEGINSIIVLLEQKIARELPYLAPPPSP